MAIAFAGLNTTTSTANATSYATGATYTPTANALVLALVVASDTNTNPGTFTGNGGTWVLVNANPYSGAHMVYIYRTMIASPTTTVGTFDCTGNAATGAGIRVVEFTGVDTSGTNGSGAIVQSAVKTDNTANPDVTLAALDASGNNAVSAVFGNGINPFAAGAEASWVEDLDTGYATPAIGMYHTYRLGTTDNTVVVTRGAAAFSGVAVEIKAAAGAPTIDSFPHIGGGYFPGPGDQG